MMCRRDVLHRRLFCAPVDVHRDGRGIGLAAGGWRDGGCEAVGVITSSRAEGPMNRRDGGGGRDDSGDLGTAIEHVPSWRSTVRRLVTTAIIVAMATPAYAQLSPGSGAPPTGAPATGSPGAASPQGGRPSITLGGEKKAKTEDEIKYERELDELTSRASTRSPIRRPRRTLGETSAAWRRPSPLPARSGPVRNRGGFSQGGRRRNPTPSQAWCARQHGVIGEEGLPFGAGRRAEAIDNVGGPYALKALMLSRRTWTPKNLRRPARW
jgi:hypothetical protein